MSTATTESPRLHPGDFDFTQLRLLNRGGYCDLYKASHAKWGPVALKRLRPRGEVNHEREQKLFKREAKVWEKLWHRNIVRFYGCLETDGRLYLVSPWVTGGNLQEFLKRDAKADRLRPIHAATAGLHYLHREGIIHGDLKAANILVKQIDWEVFEFQLCDFGMSKLVEAPTTSSDQFAGSVRWMSPDILLGEPRSFSSDIYAFGMTIYEILYGLVPFAGDGDWTDVTVIMKVTVEDARPSCPLVHPSEWKKYSPGDLRDLQILAQQCWSRDPNARGTALEIKGVLERTWPINSIEIPEADLTAHQDPGSSKPSGTTKQGVSDSIATTYHTALSSGGISLFYWPCGVKFWFRFWLPFISLISGPFWRSNELSKAFSFGAEDERCSKLARV